MRVAARPGGEPVGWNRRRLLSAGLVLALAAPVIAGCTTQSTPPPPDPLLPVLRAAKADVTAAQAAATAFPDNAPTFSAIATVRQQQAGALAKEINRASPTSTPASSSAPATPPGTEAAARQQLNQALTAAQQQVATMLPGVPRYRAGLLGSVAAGCASLTEALSSAPLTQPSAPTASAAGQSGTLPSDTTDALQQALAAEHAAMWLYGTASAFVSGSTGNELVVAMNATQFSRDATEALLTAGGATPKPAAPAYLTPQPITNQNSALAALATAESDAEVAWRAVLERADDAGLRQVALTALSDSAVRQTRWRRLSGVTPASVAMPGQPVAS